MSESTPFLEQNPFGQGCLTGRFHVRTFGCQMNEHDSERLKGILLTMGLQESRDVEKADIVILNTCSIRAKAGQKVFSELGRLKRFKAEKPHRILVVCGCLAQQEGNRIFRRSPHVDIVMGPRNLAQLPQLLSRVLSGSRRVQRLSKPRTEPKLEGMPIARTSKVKGYITIMEGCDRFCTFCIVPFTRGRETCRPAPRIVAEAVRLQQAGYREIVLLGQTVNAYRWEGISFAGLLRMIQEQAPSIRRIRFTSPHPSDVTGELIETMRDSPAVCRQLHLPLQSGSDRILHAMRRPYSRTEYLDLVHRLREAIPEIALSTDIIVGFPGETESDFEETLHLVEAVQYDTMFSFKYSPRPFTAAWKYGDPVPSEVKTRRIVTLQKLQTAIQTAKNTQLIGSVREVLFEERSKKNPEHLEGRTEFNRIINTPVDPASWIGRFGWVHVTGAGPNSLRGERVDRPDSAHGLT